MSTLFVIIKSLSLSLAYILSPVFQPCFLIFYPLSQPTCATVTDLSTTSCSFQTRSLHSPRSNSSEVSLPGHHLLLPSKSCPLVQGSLTLSCNKVSFLFVSFKVSFFSSLNMICLGVDFLEFFSAWRFPNFLWYCNDVYFTV